MARLRSPALRVVSHHGFAPAAESRVPPCPLRLPRPPLASAAAWCLPSPPSLPLHWAALLDSQRAQWQARQSTQQQCLCRDAGLSGAM